MKKYADVREEMQPGDVIAFGGKGHFSDIIKFATRSSVSHVGVVLKTERRGASRDGYFNQIIESTSLDGFSGVVISKLSKRVKAYGGEVWWLRLNEATRTRMDEDAFFDFLIEQEGKKYDMPQAVKSALDSLGALTRNDEDFARFFCSELVAAALEASGAIDVVNASEVTPIDLCRWSIYERCVQLKGSRKVKISGFSTLSPGAWR